MKHLTIPPQILQQINERGLSDVLDEISCREEMARSELLRWKTLRQALQAKIPNTGSEAEQAFWDAAQGHLDLVCQYPIGKFFIDFSVVNTSLLIEIDGHDYHKTREQRSRDAKRDRELHAMGYTVLRFTGSEVYNDPAGCVDQVKNILGNGNDSH